MKNYKNKEIELQHKRLMSQKDRAGPDYRPHCGKLFCLRRCGV